MLTIVATRRSETAAEDPIWITEETITAPVGESGSFTLPGVRPGTWALGLRYTPLRRGGTEFTVPWREIEVEAEPLRLQVDAGRLASARGTVRWQPSRLEPGRLLVIARDVESPMPRELALVASDLRCAVNSEGEFDLRVPGGRYELMVLDAVTGVLLGSSEPVSLRAGQALEQDLELAIGTLRIDPRVDGPVVPSRISIQGEAGEEGYIDLLFPGLSLTGVRDPFEVYCPPGTVRLQALNWKVALKASWLRLRQFEDGLEVVKQVEARVLAGKVVDVSF